MFSSSYFAQEYFNDYFKITGEVYELPDVTGGGGGKAVQVNWQEIQALGLRKDEEEILEFIVAFVLSR